MPNESLTTLMLLAGTIGAFHTLVGPDHYIPFVAMARAGRWPFRKTVIISTLCGFGHVSSSVLIGVFGAAFLRQVEVLTGIEAFRGQLAALLLTAFGLVYLVWGINRAIRNKPHAHIHVHGDGVVHSHVHQHDGDHLHPHTTPNAVKMTPWILFTIFVFGPCEPLIPILMLPALQHGWLAMLIVSGVFAIATITTMLAMVLLTLAGMKALSFASLERYTHALSGAALMLCGGAMLMGL